MLQENQTQGNSITEDQMSLMRKLFSEDIESFGQFFFKHHLRLETPVFHREIFKLYEDRTVRNIGIAAPRSHAKSTITDLVYLAWEILHNRCRFVLLVSDTYSQATLFLESLKAEFESNDKLIAFYGNMVSKNWSEGEITVNGVMVKALGAGMKVRGLKYLDARPDLIVVDDLENDELVESAERRDKLERWFNGALIPSMAKGGRIVMIGTILHYDSLLSKVIDPKKYLSFKKRVYRAIGDFGALWPEHLDLAELEAIKEDYLSKGQGYLFYQEYQNDPVSDENRKFKLENFKYIEDENALLAREINTYITIDRAYSLDKTADFTGIVVNSVDRENNWNIRLAERFKGTEKELIDKIFALFSYFNPIKFGIEQKAFEYTIKPTLDSEMRRRNQFFLVEPLKDLGKSKTLRIEGLVPRFESGSIYLKRDQTDLIDELMKFPRAKHDDLCLVGDTKIATLFGDKELKDIKVGDKVITPFGIRKVTASACTGIKNVITRKGLTGTNNHPVFFKSLGFANLDTLEYHNDISNLSLYELLLWKYQKLLSLMESPINSWGKESITLASQKLIKDGKILKDFMWRFGNFIRERKFQKVGLFTIKTIIHLITTLLIWSVYIVGSISQTTCERIIIRILKVLKKGLSMPESSLHSGIKVKKEKSGIRRLLRNNGKILANLIASVKFVGRFFLPSTLMPSCVQDIAVQRRDDFQELMMRTGTVQDVEKNLDVIDTQKIDFVPEVVVKKVYNITVEKDNVYYANGVLVGNCDALSYQLSIADSGAPNQNKARIFYPTRKRVFSFKR